MSEIEELKSAQRYLATGEKDKALPLLWKLYVSKDVRIRMDVGLALLVALDYFTQNEQLLEVADKTLEAASTLGRSDVHAYLLSKKAQFLFTKLSLLTYRQRNLILAAGVFQWIGFSLEKDKKEYEDIITKRDQLEKEISSLEAAVLTSIQSNEDRYLRGHIFMSLGEIYFSRFLHDQLDLMSGRRLRCKIMNIYFVRRWNLDKLIGYDRNARRKLYGSYRKCIDFLEKAVKEFKVENHESDVAHALYNLAAKFTLAYRFFKAKRYLKQAKRLAEMRNEKVLLTQIGELEKKIKDKNRHTRNYVEEFGLDLPRN